jgi:hypothetical protein
MNIDLTATDENTLIDPEIEAGDKIDDPIGELQDQIWFTFWADDGDNLFEVGELVIYDGWLSGMERAITIADSKYNVWGLTDPTGAPLPVPALQEVYIAKAWCYGNMLGWSPLEQGLYESVEQAWDEVGTTGVSCSGEDYGQTVHNLSQTDSVTLDVSFSAVQERHNGEYTCGGVIPEPSVATKR